MMFTKHRETWRVDEAGGLWFEIDADHAECWGERMHSGRRWLRWCGIDI